MFCPRCGSTNGDEARVCDQCGFALVEAAKKLEEGPKRSVREPSARVGTMLGVAVVPAGAFAPPSEAPPGSRAGTMLGFAVVPEGSVGPGSVAHPPHSRAVPLAAPVPHVAPFPVPVALAPSAEPAVAHYVARSAGTMGFAMPPVATQTQTAVHATTPETAPPSPRRMLAELVSRHGHAVLGDAERCAVALSDDYQRQVRLLVTALQMNVPQRLIAESAHTPANQVIASLSHELAQSIGVPQAPARWAVESWALAFQIIAPR